MKKNRVEQLVESSYGSLHPPPHGREELLENLTTVAQRQRSPWRPIGIAALVLVGIAGLAQLGTHVWDLSLADGEDRGGIQLPTVSRPSSGVVAPAKDECHVRLSAKGEVFVVKDKKWIAVNLNELGEHLRARTIGHGNFGRTNLGAKISELPIVLAVDRKAPWIYVQWIMLVCAEEHAPKLRYLVRSPEANARDYRLDAALPTDPGLQEEEVVEEEGKPANPPKTRKLKERAINVSIRIRPTNEGIEYSFGDRKATDLAAVARWLNDALEAVNEKKLIGIAEVKGVARAPFGPIAKVMAEFRRAGYTRLHFFGTAIPSKKQREAKPLTLPARRK